MVLLAVFMTFATGSMYFEIQWDKNSWISQTSKGTDVFYLTLYTFYSADNILAH